MSDVGDAEDGEGGVSFESLLDLDPRDLHELTASGFVDALPERDLSMTEAEAVAKALGAEVLSRVTFDDEEGRRHVWAMGLLVGGDAVLLSRAGEEEAREDERGAEWSAYVVASGVRDDEFHRAFDTAVRRMFGQGLGPVETLAYDEETGEVVERFGGEEGSA